MANFVFNIAKGRIAEKIADGAVLKLLVLKAAAADSVLQDLTTVAAVLADGSTTEADFTNYARVTLTNVTATVNNGTNEVTADFDDVTFSTAGGASNNTTTDAIVYEEVAGGDANCIPLTQIDAVFTTDGNDVNLVVPAGGFWSST